MMVRYNAGFVEIKTETGKYNLDLRETSLLCKRLRYYRSNCKNEESHRAITAMLDMILSAERELLSYHELKSLIRIDTTGQFYIQDV